MLDASSISPAIILKLPCDCYPSGLGTNLKLAGDVQKHEEGCDRESVAPFCSPKHKRSAIVTWSYSSRSALIVCRAVFVCFSILARTSEALAFLFVQNVLKLFAHT